MRIRSRLWVAAAISAAVAVAVLTVLAYVVRHSDESLRAQRDSQEIARSVASLLTLTQEYTIYGGERSTAQWRARYRQLVQTVQDTLARDATPHPALLEVQQHVRDLLPLYEGLQTAFRDNSTDFAQRRRELMVERLVSESQDLVEARYRWASAIGEQQLQDQRWINAAILAAPTLLLAVIVALALLVGRRVLRPLDRLPMNSSAAWALTRWSAAAASILSPTTRNPRSWWAKA